MKKLFLALAVLVATITGFSAVSNKVQAETTVKIASDSAYAPFEFQNSQKKWVGIDVDIMQEVAKINDWKLEMTYPGFDAALQNLKAGQVDGVIAGMTITDERKQTFDFSSPYYSSALTLATTKDSKLTSYDDLKGKAVGAKNGTAAQSWLQENQKKYGYTIKTYTDGVHMFSALASGNIAGAMDEVPVISYAIKQGQNLAMNLPSISLPGGYGFAVMKGQNPKLVAGFNKAMSQMKSNGDYDKILKKYGVTATNSSPSASTTKITAKKAVYTIASDNSFAPFEFQDSNKQYTGIDVDLLNAIAKAQGFKLKWNFIGFAPALNALTSGQADGMMSGMSITDERQKVFDFSTAYFSSNLTLATAKTNDKIKSWSDLKGATLGAKNGTASYDYLNARAKKYGYTVKTFTDATSMYASLNNGSLDAVMDDEPVIDYAIKQGQQMKTPLKAIPDGQYGFAVKKGQNPELLAMFNQGLKDLRANGQYDKIVANYLGNKSESAAKTTKDTSETTMAGIVKNNWGQILKGLWITIQLAFVSFVLALIVGIIFGMFSVSENGILRGISRIYVDLNRAVPLLVLTIFIFYGIPNLLQMITGHQSPMNEFTAGVIALTLNESSYIAEIVRGGIKAVPAGQMEASRSLGIPYLTTMRRVILPQAVKITIPSLINQFIITVKDTTLVSVIGLVELMQTGQIIVARNFQAFRVYGLLLIVYAVILLLLMWLGRRVEKKFK
ncbi:amino acid ABC transporter substrate-binding protein/permease [Lactococcus kimchii]|uniref:amino acid ABC transporter substrate-binding protein/permease n=1 Tax=Lactococcus sp. S-13 TaxID=2507158 RepID=UPI001022C717|nr:amino acid ABC transporter substrate-binding protein/permease [Lactococcus sp. S-13]RZI48966.1 transporter substrate-binding domain-containing protein [Lactococcus sp. S-13]